MGDESEHWCEVSMCVLASALVVTDLFSPANVVRDVDVSSVSVSDFEMVEPQTFFLSPESVTPAFRWSVNSARTRRQTWRRSLSSRYPRERQ